MPSSVSARKIKGQLYLVTDIDKGLLSELKMIVDGIGKDRISSSRQNRSHLQKVDGSFLLIREGNSHPKVVLFNKEGQFSGVEQTSDSALLVENRQNFISIEKTLIFLEHEVGLNITAPIDVIFADGNEISNSLHHDFLFHYKQLYLFFDLDLGGIIIARNINKLLPNTPKEFLIPKNIEIRLADIVERQPPEYTDQVIKLGLTDPFIAPYAKLIKDHQRILEQESYLYEK